MDKERLRERIVKGIKFFRALEEKEDKVLFRKYWRSFLKIVEEYISGPAEDVYQKAREIFNKKK